jgi:GNAT superfamily N-acetyltransferase
MEIRTYNSAQLRDLIYSQEYKLMPVIPISTHRAISHSHNPRAEPADTLMIIAWENEKMAGYLGILADRIYNSEGNEYKCGWLSCMWVDPHVRGKGVAKQLIATAFENWNDHILVTEFTPEAKGLYDRTGHFTGLKINKGLRCFLRFNLHDILPKRNPKYKPYTGVLKLADRVANLFVDLKLSFTKIKAGFSFEQVPEIDDALAQFIISKQNNEFEKRGKDDLNWIIKYPWLIESPSTDESVRYHFSSVSHRFQNLCFKLADNGSIKACLHYTIRDHHLKIPYAYFDKGYLNDIVQHIYKVMLENEADMLTVFHTDMVNYFSSHPTPFIYKRPIKSHYIISKALDAHFPDKGSVTIQDGDADCAFT